ncbi:MAG: PKD domain-containing protein [Dysgonamonadaceae bacterium]|jgi:hypothetical protein|nr:PKD domain-containing protein [Dysgonamonadaceae bacterium]
MKRNIIKGIILLCGCLALASCRYEEIVPFDYPEGQVYLPVAYSGTVYAIDDISLPTYDTPTSGAPYRYLLSDDKTRFNVPLSVYRSGLNPGNAVTVSIADNRQLVTDSKGEGKALSESVELLPESVYSCNASVKFDEGQIVAPFSLQVDFSFLKQNIGKQFAAGISISSKEQTCNPKLSSVIVLIDTRFLQAEPSFVFAIDAADSLKAVFNNSSRFADPASYSWDFGDGSVKSSETNPAHVFPAAGSYTVSLTAINPLTNEKKTASEEVVIK